jgi:hypothetical protein
MSPVKYELGFYIPEDGILHSDRRENLKSYRTHQDDKSVHWSSHLVTKARYFPFSNKIKYSVNCHYCKNVLSDFFHP